MINKIAKTPREIVEHLDKYIIGQEKAKKCVAIALRNRWRRQAVSGDMQSEIQPNNILMIGPTGVGKTEIARRLAAMASAPFLKVEASKFTEIGYVGRDVESMVRDLVDLAVNMVRQEKAEAVEGKAQENVEERLLDLLLPPPRSKKNQPPEDVVQLESGDIDIGNTREKLRQQLRDGKLEKRTVEIEAAQDRFPVVEIFSPMGMEELGINFQEMFSGIVPKKTKRRKTTVSEARKFLFADELDRLVNMDDVIADALERAQQSGIIFVDEIDKICGEKSKTGPDVSREGVQRDILPIVEGSTVMTKYGLVKTDHMLFIAAGAFHSSKPSDMVPELQGRFPIRVELGSLDAKDFVKILTEPQNALIKQYVALLKAEDVNLTFDKKAIERIAEIAEQVNNSMENIGARRLHTVMTTLLEDIMFEAPAGQKNIRITVGMVNKKLGEIIEDEDLSRYIL